MGVAPADAAREAGAAGTGGRRRRHRVKVGRRVFQIDKERIRVQGVCITIAAASSIAMAALAGRGRIAADGVTAGI